jgi:DNA-binding HxlR family transcriptional regulator
VGAPVRGSRSGRPIMVVLDLLGRRWTLRVLWELREAPAASVRELRDRCDGMSSSVLWQRLRELREAGLVETLEGGGLQLTDDGRSLARQVAGLEQWAQDWASRGVVEDQPQRRAPS